MSSEWLANADATNHVKNLLLKAGLPLEMQTSEVCRKFISNHGNTNLAIRFSAGRTVYGDENTDNASREIDQVLKMSSNITISKDRVIYLSLFVPIECKHRNNLEVFGFPYKDVGLETIAYPVITDSLNGSSMVNKITKSLPAIMNDKVLYGISLLEIEAGKTPKGVIGEDLVYKAGTALYDYVKSWIDASPEQDQERIVEKLPTFGDIQRMMNYAKSFRGSWPFIKSVMNSWTEDIIDNFNRQYVDGDWTYHGIDIFLPLLCVDAPLYSVEVSENTELQSFHAKELLTTGIIVPRWPKSSPYYLANPSSESLLGITNPQSLNSVLESVYEWFLSIIQLIEQAPTKDKERMFIEAAMFRYVWHNLNQSGSPQIYL